MRLPNLVGVIILLVLAALGGLFYMRLSVAPTQAPAQGPGGAQPAAARQPAGGELITAAENGQGETAEKLIGNGVDPNVRDSQGQTALHRAAVNGHADTAARLIKAGADINATNDEGKTALHLAAERGHGEMVASLLKLGANAAALDKAGLSPRDLALRGNHTQAAQTLDAALPGQKVR